MVYREMLRKCTKVVFFDLEPALTFWGPKAKIKDARELGPPAKAGFGLVALAWVVVAMAL